LQQKIHDLTEKIEEISAQYQNSGFAKFKNDLAELAVLKLAPITEKFNEIKKDKTYLQNILKNGSEQAKEIANNKIIQVKNLVGLA
jgi:tryptophanyl-tRNA synthetase